MEEKAEKNSEWVDGEDCPQSPSFACDLAF